MSNEGELQARTAAEWSRSEVADAVDLHLSISSREQPLRPHSIFTLVFVPQSTPTYPLDPEPIVPYKLSTGHTAAYPGPTAGYRLDHP